MLLDLGEDPVTIYAFCPAAGFDFFESKIFPCLCRDGFHRPFYIIHEIHMLVEIEIAQPDTELFIEVDFFQLRQFLEWIVEGTWYFRNRYL